MLGLEYGQSFIFFLKLFLLTEYLFLFNLIHADPEASKILKTMFSCQRKKKKDIEKYKG